MIEMGEKAELVTAARDARRVANFILNFMGENDTIVLSKMQAKMQGAKSRIQAKLKLNAKKRMGISRCSVRPSTRKSYRHSMR